MRLSKITSFSLIVILLFVVTGNGKQKEGIIDQKQELEKIKKEVESGKEKIDSLKTEARGVQKRIGEYDQKIASNQKIIRRLNNELSLLNNNVNSAETDLVQNTESLERTRRRYLGNIRQFYYLTRQTQNRPVDLPNSELELNRQVMYLAAVSGFESGNVDQANELLENSIIKLEDLSGQTKEVNRLKQKKVTSTSLEKSKKRQQEKTLTKLRRLEMAEADRIMMLEEAAKEMAKIIERLELERVRLAEERASQTELSIFASLKGQLLSPMKGKVIRPFGNLVDRVTKLKSFSPGISIKGRPNRKIIAVASGSVAYIGNLRGYGNFVIINHDNQYYTTYAGLGIVSVLEGQYILSGTKIGDAGEDGMSQFELRKGREALDPVKWIRIDSF